MLICGLDLILFFGEVRVTGCPPTKYFRDLRPPQRAANKCPGQVVGGDEVGSPHTRLL